MDADPNGRIDRVVLMSLISSDRWTTGSEIGAQIGISVGRIEHAIADLIADGAKIDASSQGYRKYSGQRAKVESAPVRTTVSPPEPAPAPSMPVTPPRPVTVPTPITAKQAPPSTRIATASPFGQAIRARRIILGLSQNQLARQAGCDPAYVNRIERDPESKPSRAITLSIASVLNLDASQTDRLLTLAGHATETDWQTRAEFAEASLDAIRKALAHADFAIAPSRQEAAS